MQGIKRFVGITMIALAGYGLYLLISNPDKVLGPNLPFTYRNLAEYNRKLDSFRRVKDAWHSIPKAPPASGYALRQLNLRSGPGTNFHLLTVIPKDARLNLLPMVGPGKRGDWYKIGIEGQLGWAHGKYIGLTTRSDELKEDLSAVLPSGNSCFQK